MVDGLYSLSDGQIGLVVIGGSFLVAAALCLGLCGVLHR